MKNDESFLHEIFCVICFGVLLVLTGCNTVTHYDENGKITRVEKVTNFSRVMDGTNNKSQLVFIDGTWVDFQASATAGENFSPGVKTQYASGKAAFINIKDNTNTKGVSDIVEKFFSGKLELGKDGLKKE